MLTRKEILDTYKVSEGDTICSPGKFEGESIYIPAAYEIMMHGFAENWYEPCEECSGEDCECEDRSPDAIIVEISEDLRKEFPTELDGKRAIAFYIRDDGFVTECRVPKRWLKENPA